MELGIVVSHLHLRSEDAAVLRLLRRCGPDIRELHLGLHAVGHTYDAIARDGALANYPGLQRYADDRYHGLVRMASAVTSKGSDALDGIIYLAPPDDRSSLLPETLALERQCLVHGKPFLSTIASVVDWIRTEQILAGNAPSLMNARPDSDSSSQTLALIAHDGMKAAMMTFASNHYELLSGFSRRVSTGTTGRQLNMLARDRGWPSDTTWTSCYDSGPLGGDVQIADLVLMHRVQRVIFFRDPLVSHQHEADIRVLERAIAAIGEETCYIACPAMAARWAEAAKRCMSERHRS